MATTTAQAASPPSAGRPGPRRIWFVVLVIGGLVLSLITGVLIGRQSTTPQDPPGLAGPTVAAMLAGRVAAINEGTASDIASFYTVDAVLEEFDQQSPVVTSGGPAIGAHLSGYQSLGFRIEQTGTTTQLGPYVAEPLLWSGGYGGMAVYQLTDDGLIAHQWVAGGPIPGSTGP